ncbi:MAG: flavodoxin family protein [Deltaproteobacteria bacterium]|nr:flavodoxin family protein [Deltaproteobacteria bacterium]
MSKRVLVLSGSPRKRGNTDVLGNEFIRGAANAGHETERIFIGDKKVNGCLGCFACQKNEGLCVQKDDMDDICTKMVAADVIVLVASVYFYTFNAQMKAVLDRTIAITGAFRDKTVYLVAAGQAPEEKYFTIMIESFRKYIGCFQNMREGGIVFGYGVSDAGDIKDNQAMGQAYEMGRNIG